MSAEQSKIRILDNARVNGPYYRLILDAARISRIARPGQFVMLRVNKSGVPLLRRPLSIHAVSGQKLVIFYEALGPATRLLSTMRSSEETDIIGPLGNGFEYQAKDIRTRRPILVCGGVGVAPLNFLAQELTSRKQRPGDQPPLTLIGGRSEKHILCEKEFQKKGCVVKIATDDGSRGFKGRVTELLENLLSAADRKASVIYSCGPRPMLKEVSRISAKHKIPAWISLEEHMSCGIGACLGCVVNTTEGFKRVCKEGPVFRGEEIVW